MHSTFCVLCSHNTVLTGIAPNSSSGSGNSEDNSQIHAGAPLFPSALWLAGSRQAEKINYKAFGLRSQTAEPCWLPPSTRRRAASQQAPSPLCKGLTKPFQPHPWEEGMAKHRDPLADRALHLMRHLPRT